jgi:hypothetical protein
MPNDWAPTVARFRDLVERIEERNDENAEEQDAILRRVAGLAKKVQPLFDAWCRDYNWIEVHLRAAKDAHKTYESVTSTVDPSVEIARLAAGFGVSPAIVQRRATANIFEDVLEDDVFVDASPDAE